jgi:hypothetical protein
MTKPMAQCKRVLALVWFIGAGVLFFMLLMQSVLGRYGDRTSDAWSWLLPSIMPTLSLIIGVLVAEGPLARPNAALADRFLYRLTLGISVVYLLAVLMVFLLQPFSTVGPFELMNQANLWLGPIQGLTAAALGAFFVKSPASGNAVPRGDAGS